MNHKDMVANSHFNANIIGIKIIKKIIFVSTTKEINLCKIINSDNSEKNYIENLCKIPYECSRNGQSNNFYEVWIGENKNYFLSVIHDLSKIMIYKIYENSFHVEQYVEIDSKFNSIQGIFYDEYKKDFIFNENFKTNVDNKFIERKSTPMFNQKNQINKLNNDFSKDENQLTELENQLGYLFVVDGNGINIKVYKINTKEKINENVCDLYRGKTNSFISSIILIDNNTAAISSSNKTIHIFDLVNKNVENLSFSYWGKFRNYFTSYQGNTSIIKIRINELLDKHDDYGIYESDFNKKGNILFFDDENSILKVLGFNGKLYNIEIDHSQQDYKYLKIYDWTSYSQKRRKLITEKKSKSSEFEVISNPSINENLFGDKILIDNDNFKKIIENKQYEIEEESKITDRIKDGSANTKTSSSGESISISIDNNSSNMVYFNEKNSKNKNLEKWKIV